MASFHTRTKFKVKMIITEEQETDFNNAVNCHICNKELGDDRVRDHDHFNGLYRGAAHNKCNLQYRPMNELPIVFFNLTGYDSHLIMQYVDGKYEIDCIANNEESYKTFTFLKKYSDRDGKEKRAKVLKSVDAAQFLTGSLDANASPLSLDEFKYTLKKFGNG